MRNPLIIHGCWAAFVFVVATWFMLRGTYAGVKPPPVRDYRVRVIEAVLLAEARGEGPGGVERVAEVIWNRMKVGKDESSATYIVTRPKQFSCLNGVSTDVLLEQREGWSVPTDTSNMAQRCAYSLVFHNASGQAFQEGKRGLTKGATHYHATSEHPYWVGNNKPVHVYKNHVFYRLS